MHNRESTYRIAIRRTAGMLVLGLAMPWSPPLALSQTETVVYAFKGGPDGRTPKEVLFAMTKETCTGQPG
jgi:hypothetical protein